MNTSTSHSGTGGKVAAEFGFWPVEGNNVATIEQIRIGFDQLLTTIKGGVAPGNERYLALVKTKLEEACFYAIKGVAKPTGN